MANPKTLWKSLAKALAADRAALEGKRRRPAKNGRRSGSPRLSKKYPGDFEGRFDVSYHPDIDGEPDPGEVVWTWVPYEEDHKRGKDRPVLLVGRDGDWLLGLMLTSKDHDRDAADEARWGRHWIDIGSGGWDSKGRPSEARLDRILRIDPRAVRREGAVLKKSIFTKVENSLARTLGW